MAEKKKWKVCVTGEAPPSDFYVEGETQEEADAEARECLEEWADQVEIELEEDQ